MPSTRIHIGVDIGSVSLKMAVAAPREMDLSSLDFRHVVAGGTGLWLSPYIRTQGTPRACFQATWERMNSLFPEISGSVLWMTGRGGKIVSEHMKLNYIQEFKTIAECIGRLFPAVKTVFEMGGETSKFLQIHHTNGQIQIADYEMNGECAAGTGLFFDQQADRLRVRVEEVGQMIDEAERSAAIAGRCSVFAKSDMIHAQQRGYLPGEILKGLSEAVVRNFKGTVTKGKKIEKQVAFIGGMAANNGVVKAMRALFELDSDEFIVPDSFNSIGAIGAVMLGMCSADPVSVPVKFSGSGGISSRYPTEEPLSLRKVLLLRDEYPSVHVPGTGTFDAFLGIDIGSVSTNLALITPEGDLIHGIYLMTEGRPVDVVGRAFDEIARLFGDRVNVLGVGTTGSGRELIGVLVGADVIKDEITAHKTGALSISRKILKRQVDTIFEIGGQDSKFISLKDGIVTDFALNEACAAGTGSFLEEQAHQIGIRIKDEFARLALSSQHPLQLGERCTVFMEKEMIPYLRRGIPKNDIVAGLAISVVHNYLNRVVKKRPVGDVIFFQGGTAYNDAVAAAFSTVLDKEIIVPPHNGIIGAIGAALLVKDSQKQPSRFRGWDLSKIQWKIREFTCGACSNSCTVQEFDIESEKTYWGDKCSERYRKRSKSVHVASIPDLFAFRETITFQNSGDSEEDHPDTLMIPRVLHLFDRFPFWKSYFEGLGFKVSITGWTNAGIIHSGLEATVAEPCFPVQVAQGHLAHLMNGRTGTVFLPNTVNEKAPADTVASFICPWTQTSPLIALHSPMLSILKDRMYSPTVQFRLDDHLLEKSLYIQASERFKVSRKLHRMAFEEASGCQERFNQVLYEKGMDVLNRIVKEELPGIVLIGRPYNLYDSGLNLNIPRKLRNQYGINVIPMDFLPFETVSILEINDHMFWNYGRRIIQAARFVRDYRNLEVIYLSNFKCGPDSYIRHYIEEALGRPFLFLQLDSHSNDAGIMTRIEAFLESKKMI